MSPSSLIAAAHRLDSPDAWQAWRAHVEALEPACPPSPWAGWAYWEVCARLLGHQGCWALEVRDAAEGPLLAAAVLREEVVRRARVTLRSLRAFDQVSFMRTPAFLAPRGDEERVAPAVADAMIAACRDARADLVTLYRQDDATAAPLTRALRARGVTVRADCWTRAAQVVQPDDPGDDLEARHPGLVRSIERSRRKLARDGRAEPRHDVVTAAELDPSAWQAALERFGALDQKTWQHAWAAASEQVDPARTRAFDAACRDLWRQRGLLELHFLTLPGDDGLDRDLALALALREGERCWLLQSGFDPAWAACSPGRMLLFEVLRDGRAPGVRVFELGGEVLGWKATWADRFEEVRRLEWAGATWKGRLWSLVQSLRTYLTDRL